MILDTVEICKNINGELATFIYNIIRIIKLGVPIILVIIGMIDFGKGVVASKEDEIAKVRGSFIKRIIAGAAVFLMITLTQLVITVLDRNSSGTIWDCANKIMNGEKNAKPEETEEIEKEEQIPEMTDEQRNIIHCCIEAGGKIKGTDEGDIQCIGETQEVNENFNKCKAN